MTPWPRASKWVNTLIVAILMMSISAWADENEALKKGVVRVVAQSEGKQSEGTGFIVKSQAGIVFIVTAAHVVGNDQAPRIEFYTGKNRTMAARIIGREAGDDNGLAVLAVEGQIPAHAILPLNQEKRIKDGDAVTMVGFPRMLGVPWAVTEGKIIARKGKMIILSGLVEEGNSGGPLVKDGEVIGVIAAKVGSYFYAVPAIVAKYALDSWRVGFGVTLRSTPQTLSLESIGRMIREMRLNHPHDLSKDGLLGNFFGDFEHEFEPQTFAAQPVVIDRATGLMWQQQGSGVELPYKVAEMYVEDLNRARYAGFSDWRMPTLEELASLILARGTDKGVFINAAFNASQTKLWTSDLVSLSGPARGHWYIDFSQGAIFDSQRHARAHFVRVVRSGTETPAQSPTIGQDASGKPAPPVQASEIIGKDGAVMLLVQAGSFQMGTDDKYSGPIHTVSLDSFYLDQYEVTVEQYAKFLETSKWEEPKSWRQIRRLLYPKAPMMDVDWLDAVVYCRWAGKRLPTEAEWEKAARGTDGRRYPWGNEVPSSIAANIWSRIGAHSGTGDFADIVEAYRLNQLTFNMEEREAVSAGEKFLKADLGTVGSFALDKSPYGIFDLAGGVSEWVADWYQGAYYKVSPEQNPSGPRLNSGNRFQDEYKVIRGGSWLNHKSKDKSEAMTEHDYAHSQTFVRASRAWYEAAPHNGFRCARDVPK